MALDVSKLEKVVELANGALQARCPACAEGGGDRKGEHLLIYPDGKFGCCAHQGDSEHRKRIYGLAGERVRRAIKVRVTAKLIGTVQAGILGRLGQSFSAPVRKAMGPDGPDGVNEVETESEDRTPRTEDAMSDDDSVEGCSLPRTGRTGETESECDGVLPLTCSRTLRTPQNPSNLATKESSEIDNTLNTYKEFCEGVRPVRQQRQWMPYLSPGETLVIPFDGPERFHWWKGGQSIAVTRAEVDGWMRESARKETNAVVV